MRRLLLVIPAVLLLAGCSAPATPATAKPTPITVGEDANAIAERISGCKNVTTEDVGKGGPGLVSAASCTLSGHKLFVDSFVSTDKADLKPLLMASGHEAYFTTGVAWAVILGDDETLQLQITNEAGALLQGALAGHSATPNLDAEKRTAAGVAKSLNGSVVHVQP